MPDFGACRIKSTSCPHKTNCHGPTLLPTLPPHEACSSLAFLSLSLSFFPHFVLTPPSWVYTQVTSSNYPDLTETSLILQETFQTLRLSLVPLLRAPREPWTSSFSRFHWFIVIFLILVSPVEWSLMRVETSVWSLLFPPGSGLDPGTWRNRSNIHTVMVRHSSVSLIPALRSQKQADSMSWSPAWST